MSWWVAAQLLADHHHHVLLLLLRHRLRRLRFRSDVQPLTDRTTRTWLRFI